MMKQNAVNQPGAKASNRGVSQQFEFINLLNRPGLTDVGTKKAVRAHAMRDFRRRRGESYDNGRRKETSNIKNADSSNPSPTAQPSRNGVALDHPEWAYSTDVADGPLSLKDTAYAEEDFHFFTPNGRNGDVFKSPFNFNSNNTFHGSILDNDGDESDPLMSSERPRKRKKLHDYDSSPGTLSVDGDNWYSSLKPQGYHARNEMMVASPRLIKVPGAGSAEPFNALPVASTERVRILMHHYISVFLRPGSQNIPRETWISEALNDSALFQATLLPAAAHYALFHHLDLAESFHLFDQTTQIVSKRLGDPEQGTSDATLAAVICLSFVENVLGNSSASMVHLEGMKRMVDLRGGLQALGFKGVLQRMVLWADNWTGILALSPPKFPLMQPIKSSWPYGATDPNISRLKSALQEDGSRTSIVSLDSGEYQDKLFGIILRLQQLSRTLAAIHANKTTKTQAMQYNEQVFFLERQLLLSVVHPDEQPPPPHGTIPFASLIMRSFCHAAYIYIYSTLHSTLRDLPLQSPFFGVFVERLHIALSQPDLFLAWCSTSPVMLLWVMVVGAIASHRRPQRAWFMTQLTSICLTLRIPDLKKLRGLLEEMMWVQGALDSALRGLWADLMRLRTPVAAASTIRSSAGGGGGNGLMISSNLI